MSERAIQRALRVGRIRRVRRGWYAIEAPGQVEEAVRLGGALACVSALAMHGVWTMPDTRVHITGRGFARKGVRTHRGPVRQTVIVDLPIAIGQAIRCLEPDAAVVALDSAMNRRLISLLEVEAICMRSSRGRLIFGRLDSASESGIETLARLRLRRRNIALRTQVQVGEIARVDLIVGDRLVLELDGRGGHDRPGDFENDRSRDRALVAAGYLVLRASYRQVMTEWSTIEEQVLQIVRRRDHRWRRGSRR